MRSRSPTGPALTRLVGIALAGAVVGAGCGVEVERDRETEECIEELREQDVPVEDAQEQCMGGG